MPLIDYEDGWTVYERERQRLDRDQRENDDTPYPLREDARDVD